MRRLARRIGVASLAGGLAVASLVAVVAPASAANVPVAFDCQAKPPIGDPQQLALDTSIQADAPASVAVGEAFEATLAPDPITVPGEAGGYAVNDLHDLVLKVPVPAGSTYQSATLTGGENLGTGTPQVSQADNVVTVTVPGPVAGGATFRLPVLHLGLTASGAAGSTIETRLAGSSYDDPGMTFTAAVKVSFFTINVPASCFANPSPAFTSTTITEPTPPPTEEPPAP